MDEPRPFSERRRYLREDDYDAKFGDTDTGASFVSIACILGAVAVIGWALWRLIQ